ncbi:MAG: GGDEF domain-containing protein [Lachnospiraceae bacterium]
MRKNERQLMEEEANQFSLKCIVFIELLHSVVWILNLLDIFIVDWKLMAQSFFLSLLVVCVAVIVCLTAGIQKAWMKYFLLFTVVLQVTIVGIFLTYHAIVFYILPLLFSVQYRDRKMLYISYALSVLSIFATVMCGYYFGLCDANMAAVTTQKVEFYRSQSTGKLMFDQLNDNPWMVLPLFFVLPRSMALLAMIPLVQRISNSIARQALHEQYLLKLSETDQMTSLYNRNKYMRMIQSEYRRVKMIGVIFWDINELKETNDGLGHEYGDYLITSIAESIREISDETKKAYRIGGDEFAMILENPTEEEIQELLLRWKTILKMKNNLSKIELSASVGYAIGKGSEIATVISEADAAMYEEKRIYHMEE